MKKPSSFPPWLIFLGIMFLLNFPRLLILGVIGYLAYQVFQDSPSRKKSPLSDFLKDAFEKVFSDSSGETITIRPKPTKKPSFSFSPPNMNPPSLGKIIAVILPVLVIVAIIADGLVSVPAGSVAIIYDRKNGVLPDPLDAGLHLKIPFWQTATKMSIRLQEYTMSSSSREGKNRGDDSVSALTSDGQQVNIDITIRYKVNKQNAPFIFKSIGLDYEGTIVRPEVRSVVYKTITGYSSEELFNFTTRTEISNKIKSTLTESYAAKNIILDEVLLRNVQFSQSYLNAIEQKKIQVQVNEKTQLEKVAAENRKQVKITEAEAEAESIRLKGVSLRESPEVIQLQFVEKMAPQINWGILPDGALPLIDLKSMQQ